VRPNLNQQEPQRSEDVSPSGACCTRCSSRRPSRFIGARRCRLIQERPELANMALCVRWARNHIGSVPDMGMRTLLRPSPGSALEQLRIPHRSSDIAKHLRGAAGATLHTDTAYGRVSGLGLVYGAVVDPSGNLKVRRVSVAYRLKPRDIKAIAAATPCSIRSAAPLTFMHAGAELRGRVVPVRLPPTGRRQWKR
jgi:hypothetical protein